MMRVRQLGIDIYKSSKVTAIKRDGVVIENEKGESFIPADTMVLAMGARPNNAMLESLRAAGVTADTIGDATEVGKIPRRRRRLPPRRQALSLKEEIQCLTSRCCLPRAA